MLSKAVASEEGGRRMQAGWGFVVWWLLVERARRGRLNIQEARCRMGGGKKAGGKNCQGGALKRGTN